MVKMLVGLSGPAITLGAGDEHDFPDAEALRLIAAEYAVPASETKIERAVDAPIVETRRAKKKG